MKRLLEGYQNFRAQRWPRDRKLYEETASKGQKPEYLIIACSDSRSDPATVFGGHPGEFFLVRNIAALVPPHDATNGVYGTRAAIAYAVLALKVRNIVVMGHAQCGGIGAAIDPGAAHGVPYVAEWVELAKPAVERARGQPHGHGLDKNQATEREAVKLSVRRLLDYPFIAERVKAGQLAVDGMRFNIATGVLELLDQKTGQFAAVKTRRSWFW
ncbi:MAG TPA: carbonic anhydrase [Rhizomicrobium sp.]|jgi:carbonic anhydrase|nr:carbonic anhydrase [Rhizomicrobium sp.]